MFKFNNLLFAFVLSAIFAGFVVAQPPPPSSAPSKSSSNNNQTQQNFVSLDGGFNIALPQQISAFSGIKPTEGISKGGNQFVWQISQGFFMVSYVYRIFSPEEYKQVLQSSVDYLIETSTKNNGKLISKNEISLDGYSGTEVRIHLKEGAVGFSRYLLVKNRMYILTTGWKDGEDGKGQLKILNSFKLVDTKAIIAKKIEEASPESLPQLPVAKKLKSDVEDNALQGKVKSITETEEDLTGNWYSSGIKMSSEDFYNEDGNQIKSISYDYKGNPSDVTVYGYIDGMRVLKSGSIDYEYNPPPAMMPPSKEKPKPFDKRYDTKIEYSYDEKNRLKQVVNYRNNGEITGKTVYVYGEKTLEKSSYDKDGKLTYKAVETFDDKGNLIERTSDHQNSKYPISKYKYTYDSFDEKGNWTKRIVYGKEGLYDGGYKDQHYIEYRTTTYYP